MKVDPLTFCEFFNFVKMNNMYVHWSIIVENTDFSFSEE